MKALTPFLISMLFLSLRFTTFCSGAENSGGSIVFAGSTPGDDLIKSMLVIPLETKVDFIRWNLTLNGNEPEQNTFILNIVFGEAQPNTLGFKGGGQKRSFEGKYTINYDKNIKGEIYHLNSSKWSGDIKLVKLNDNLLHILTPQSRLMVGNGGWSYTLNRKGIINDSSALPVLTTSSVLSNDTAQQVVFDGRTPCQGFAAEHQMTVSASCFKLKWRFIFNRDPVTHEPTTYTIRKVVDNMPRDVSGKWTVIRGVPGNPDAVIYCLDPGDPAKSICLLAGDGNVMFFLDKKNELYVGNEDFSFTLNKKQ